MKTGGVGVNIWGLWQINETIVDKKLPIKKTVMGHNSVTIYWEICVIPENMVHKNIWKWVPAKKTIMLASLNQLIFTWKKECCIHSDQYFPLRFPYIPNNPTHWTNGIHLPNPRFRLGFGRRKPFDPEVMFSRRVRSSLPLQSTFWSLGKGGTGRWWRRRLLLSSN